MMSDKLLQLLHKHDRYKFSKSTMSRTVSDVFPVDSERLFKSHIVENIVHEIVDEEINESLKYDAEQSMKLCVDLADKVRKRVRKLNFDSIALSTPGAVISTVDDSRKKLTAVSDEEIAELLYRRVRNQYPYVEEPSFMDPDEKSQICHYITGSTLFSDTLREKRIDIREIYHDLREKEPDLFASLYKLSTDGKEMVYTNPTIWTEVFVTEKDEKPIQDYVFTCLTLDTFEDKETYFNYFVSGEYNLSDEPESHIAGRFLFNYFIDNRQIKVVAVAEEPAKNLLVPGMNAEHLYFQRRAANESAAKNETKDPSICDLNILERLRVCTMVMNSVYFEGKLKFLPEFDNIDERKCIKEEISFQDDILKLNEAKERYEEWMIVCKAQSYHADFQSEYYLSRVYKSTDEVVVYRRNEDSKIIVETLFSDVRFKI